MRGQVTLFVEIFAQELDLREIAQKLVPKVTGARKFIRAKIFKHILKNAIQKKVVLAKKLREY